ncbi:MAG: FGGY-family carbohydrate kinase, partial [Eubacteriales bacterium]
GDLLTILPRVRSAGESGAVLTEEGARLLDPTGTLTSGIPLCPPEGDAGTGMTATNSVRPRTGNVSAGTSIFSMLVLDHPLSAAYPEIDLVTTPDGAPVAMVHCNNCCAEIDAWAKIFGEFAAVCGHPMKKSDVYDALYYHALTGDADCGGVVSYNFLSGEPVLGLSDGVPMYFRTAGSRMNLANFFRAQVASSVAALKIGMDLLFQNEKVCADKFTGHGGLFKTEGVAQQILADAFGTPISVMKTAGEGGAWGMAILAAYMLRKDGRSLPDFLDECVFAGMQEKTLAPTEEGAAGFAQYVENYKSGLGRQRG